MASIWEKLTGRRRRTPLVCYLRENGPLAYEVPLFGDDPRAAIDAMLATGLAWYWRAGTASGPAEWTQLTRWSLGAFLTDLDRGDVLAVGIDPSDAPAGTIDHAVAAWLLPFCAEQPGPAHVFIGRTATRDRVFVAQQPPEVVRELLQAWGIDRAKAVRRAYARLRGETLEDISRALSQR